MPTLAEQRADIATLPFVVRLPDEADGPAAPLAEPEESDAASDSIIVW